MDDRTLSDLEARLAKLEREAVRFRKGQVTATAPLEAKLGASNEPQEASTISGTNMAENDSVAALTNATDLLLLGKIVDEPTGVSLTTTTSWAEQQYITDSSPATGASNSLGYSVAITSDGTRAVVGMPYADILSQANEGTVQIFKRTGTIWALEKAYTYSLTAGAGYELGTSVAINDAGDTVVVGSAQAQTRILTRSGTTWTEQASLAKVGSSVACSEDGNTVALANPAGGAITVHTRSGTSWSLQTTISITGYAVALSSDGNTLAVGNFSASTSKGEVKIYTRSGTTWTLQTTLTDSSGANGDQLGVSVALADDGNTLVAGASSDDISAVSNQGSAVIYTRAAGVWTQGTRLTYSAGAANDSFGFSVSINGAGTKIAVGQLNDDIGLNADRGSVVIFDYSGSVWDETTTLTAALGTAGDKLGQSVAMSDDGLYVIAGAPYDDVNTYTDHGSASVFALTTVTAAGVTVGDGTVTEAKLANNAVTSAKILDGTIATGDIADDAVTSAKLRDDASTDANRAVTTNHIRDDAITSAKIAADAVGSSEIATDAVGSAEIAADAVGSSEIAADAVTSSEIATDAVGTAEIAADAVTSSEIAADAVGSSEIAAGAVGTSELADSSVTSAKIGDGEIVNADINASAAIAYGKLSLTTSIVNGDIASAAAIAYSKLALSNSIVNADVSTSAAIAYSKLALTGSIVNADIATGAAIALSKLATDPLARANHTGTQTASTISDFDTQVRTSRLDQMATPTADVSMGSKKITSLADPTLAQDAATKTYVDTTASSGTPDADATTKGKVQLAGDLSGTAASPQIAAGAIVNADVNASAAIALSKLATDPLARANHTGTQTASTISNFDTQVRTNRLDQMAAPTASVSMNSQKITSLATPTATGDAATKAYVDGGGAINLSPYFGNADNFGTALASTACGANNNQRTGLIQIHTTVTITGITYRVGGTSNGNVKAVLFDSALTKLAETTATVAQATANTVQQVAFASTYAATPGQYYLGLCFSSSTATFQGAVFMSAGFSQTNATFAGTAPTGFAALNLTIPSMTTH